MSIITMGLYSLYWNYKVCDKMATLVIQQGGQPRITGGGWLLWTILGSIILVGPFIAIAKQIHLWNDANEIYNKKQGQVTI